MTSRERWTIYPLLFLALGAALRGKLTATIDTGQLSAKSLFCDQLVVKDCLTLVDVDGNPRMQLRATGPLGGSLELCDAGGRILATLAHDPKTGCGRLMLSAAKGAPQVVLGSADGAGLIQTATARGAPQVVIRSDSEAGAVIAVDRNRATVVELSARAGPNGVAVEPAGGPTKKPESPPEEP